MKKKEVAGVGLLIVLCLSGIWTGPAFARRAVRTATVSNAVPDWKQQKITKPIATPPDVQLSSDSNAGEETLFPEKETETPEILNQEKNPLSARWVDQVKQFEIVEDGEYLRIRYRAVMDGIPEFAVKKCSLVFFFQDATPQYFNSYDKGESWTDRRHNGKGRDYAVLPGAPSGSQSNKSASYSRGEYSSHCSFPRWKRELWEEGSSDAKYLLYETKPWCDEITYTVGGYKASSDEASKQGEIFCDVAIKNPSRLLTGVAVISPEYVEGGGSWNQGGEVLAEDYHLSRFTDRLHRHENSVVRVSPTCSEPGEAAISCSMCVDIEKETLPALGHQYGNWSHSLSPGCTTAGKERRVCSRDAAHYEERNLAALGHNFGTWNRYTAATCTAAGKERRVCSRDAAHYEERTLTALGHSYGAWRQYAAPTCLAAGKERRVCSRDTAHHEERTLTALGHSYGAWGQYTAPTCLAAGKERRVCSRDAAHYEEKNLAALGHSYGAWGQYTAATCTAAGRERRICTRNVSHYEERSLSALGHVLPSSAVQKDGYLDKYCSRNCGTRMEHIAITYRIIYDGNGADSGSMEPTEHRYDTGTALRANRFSRTGFTFLGWTSNQSGTGTVYQNAAQVKNLTKTHGAEVRLYAKWKVNAYQAKFQGNGGRNGNTITKNYQEELGALPKSERTGYQFDGWYTDPSGGVKISTSSRMPVNGATYYAHWRPNRYQLIFHNNLDTAFAGVWEEAEDQSQKVDFLFEDDGNGNAKTYAELCREPFDQEQQEAGLRFLGWYTEKTGGRKVEKAQQAAAEDMDLYAHWEPLSYVLKFHTNRETDEIQEERELRYREIFGSLPETDRVGYTFRGWYTQMLGGGVVGEGTRMPAEDYELYAHWKAKEYEVHFHYQDGVGEVDKKTVVYDKQYGDLPQAELEDFYLLGWYLRPSDKSVSSTIYAGEATPADADRIEEEHVYQKATNSDAYAFYLLNYQEKPGNTNIRPGADGIFETEDDHHYWNGADQIPGTRDDLPIMAGMDGIYGTEDDFIDNQDHTNTRPGPDGIFGTKDDELWFNGADTIPGNEDDKKIDPGKDGIYGTEDDFYEDENGNQVFPGPDHIFGTGDDLVVTPSKPEEDGEGSGSDNDNNNGGGGKPGEDTDNDSPNDNKNDSKDDFFEDDGKGGSSDSDSSDHTQGDGAGGETGREEETEAGNSGSDNGNNSNSSGSNTGGGTGGNSGGSSSGSGKVEPEDQYTGPGVNPDIKNDTKESSPVIDTEETRANPAVISPGNSKGGNGKGKGRGTPVTKTKETTIKKDAAGTQKQDAAINTEIFHERNLERADEKKADVVRKPEETIGEMQQKAENSNMAEQLLIWLKRPRNVLTVLVCGMLFGIVIVLFFLILPREEEEKEKGQKKQSLLGKWRERYGF